MSHTFASSNKQNLCYEVLNVKVPFNRGMWWTCLAFPLFTLSILLLVLSCCPTSVKLYKNALLHSNFEFTHLPHNVCRLNRCEGGGAPCYEWCLWFIVHSIVHITTCKQTDRQVQTYSQSHNMSQEATYTKKSTIIANFVHKTNPNMCNLTFCCVDIARTHDTQTYKRKRTQSISV